MQKLQLFIGSLTIAAATIGLSSDQALGSSCCFPIEGECEPCCVVDMDSYCCGGLGGDVVDSCSPADCLWSCRPTPLGSDTTLSEDVEGPPVANVPPAASADLPDNNSGCSVSQAGNDGNESVTLKPCCVYSTNPCATCCYEMSGTCCSYLGGTKKLTCSFDDCPDYCHPAPPESGAKEPVAFSTAEVYSADVEPEEEVISSPADPLSEDPDCEEEYLTTIPTETSDSNRR